MTSINDNSLAFGDWGQVASVLLHSPASPVECPECHARSVVAAWNLTDLLSREAVIEMTCATCGATKSWQMALPANVPGCWPLERLVPTVKAVAKQLESMVHQLYDELKDVPIVRFITNPLWEQARWSGTSYQWHAASEGPPLIAIGFENAEAGREIFREYTQKQGQSDQFEEIRISIIEGSPEGQQPGYSMHIYPDPDALAMYATGEGVVLNPNMIHFLGRWQRMYPIRGKTDMMLPRFKEEFSKHKQFMIAPQVPRGGQNYADPAVGIIKRSIEFRELSEITQADDIDAGALALPALIPPRA